MDDFKDRGIRAYYTSDGGYERPTTVYGGYPAHADVYPPVAYPARYPPPPHTSYPVHHHHHYSSHGGLSAFLRAAIGHMISHRHGYGYHAHVGHYGSQRYGGYYHGKFKHGKYKHGKFGKHGRHKK